MLACAVLVGASGAAAFAADGPPSGLQRDPFKRPTPVANTTANAAGVPQEWRPELRAVIFDRRHPLVNIDGRILGIGESIQGYRLLRVDEREAVLGKDGKHLTLELDRVQSR
jgi:hypothetical protein